MSDAEFISERDAEQLGEAFQQELDAREEIKQAQEALAGRLNLLEAHNNTLVPLTDSVVGAVVQRYRDRAAAGYEHYGTTMDRGDLTALAWVVHSQAEAMDLTVYLERLRKELLQLGEPHLPWALVRSFHDKYGLPVGVNPKTDYWMRMELIREETAELRNELEDLGSTQYGSKGEQHRRENILKEWGDLLFVVWGMAVEFGFDHVGAEVFRRVAESNMSKDGDVNGSGKLTKGSGYQAPDMGGLW